MGQGKELIERLALEPFEREEGHARVEAVVERLVARVRARLRERPAATARLRCEDLELDRLQHVAYRAGRRIEVVAISARDRGKDRDIEREAKMRDIDEEDAHRIDTIGERVDLGDESKE